MDVRHEMKKMSQLDRENIQDILALTPMQEGLLFYYLKTKKKCQAKNTNCNDSITRQNLIGISTLGDSHE